MTKKEKKKKVDAFKIETSGKAEPLDDWFIKVMRFSSKLSHITDYLGDNESVTVESMKRRKLTKEELVEDMKHIWDRISKAWQESRQLRIQFQKFQPGTLKDISITLDRLRSPIGRALWEFDDLNWPEDKELLYKHSQRAYKRANEYRRRLELLGSKLADDAESEFAGKEVNKKIKTNKLNNKREHKEVTIRDFMDKNCEMEYSGKAKTKKINAWKLQIERKAKGVIKPSTLGGGGKAHKYYEEELFEKWGLLRDLVGSLPKLKNHKT